MGFLVPIFLGLLALAGAQFYSNDYYENDVQPEQQYYQSHQDQYRPQQHQQQYYQDDRQPDYYGRAEDRLSQTLSYVMKKRKEAKQKQDLSKIPGIPGIDYPLYHQVPQTSFSCHNVPALPGMYANVETGCQAYHVCHDGREGDQGASFLCANGTVFNQKEFSCDWWYNVDCGEAPRLYELNLDPLKNPYVPAAHKEAIRQERLRIVVE